MNLHLPYFHASYLCLSLGLRTLLEAQVIANLLTEGIAAQFLLNMNPISNSILGLSLDTFLKLSK